MRRDATRPDLFAIPPDDMSKVALLCCVVPEDENQAHDGQWNQWPWNPEAKGVPVPDKRSPRQQGPPDTFHEGGETPLEPVETLQPFDVARQGHPKLVV